MQVWHKAGSDTAARMRLQVALYTRAWQLQVAGQWSLLRL